MFGSLRNALIAGLIAALGLVGVSYAQTGSLNPVKIVTNGNSTVGETSEVSETPEAPETPEPSETPEADETSNAQATPEATPQRSTVGCPAGFTGNHGQFVSSQPKDKRSEAAHSECGKPVKDDHEEVGDGEHGQSGDQGDQGPDDGRAGEHGTHGHGNGQD